MQAYRSSIIHFLQDPYQSPLMSSLIDPKTETGKVSNVIKNDIFQYYPDGILVVDENGKVVTVGEADQVLSQYPDITVTQYTNSLLTPGFVDTHTHMPQTQMVAAYGEQLLEWLQNYTFPIETTFADKAHCTAVVQQYLTELLRNGTTTANVFCTVHKHSAEIFFDHALKLNLRMVAGKVLMDRESQAPVGLRDTPETGYDDSRDLIEKYHNNGRCVYAITPRFAITSTDEQLKRAGELFQEYKDRGVRMHTHLSENKNEIDFTLSLFPQHDSYLKVYESNGLIGEGCTFAHCVHLTEEEKKTMAQTRSSIAFCPTSNLFLGSGLFDLDDAQNHGIRVGMGTDTAGGTSFSTGFQTMNEAYKIMQLQGKKLDSFRAFYLSTLGGAASLSLDEKIGNFKAGKEADFVVIDLNATPYYKFRKNHSNGTLHDLLFSLNILGDDRFVQATYSMGKKVWDKSDEEHVVALLNQ